MTAYQSWTLTCDGCGAKFDAGCPADLPDCKWQARHEGWVTGSRRTDPDHCPDCRLTDDEDR